MPGTMLPRLIAGKEDIAGLGYDKRFIHVHSPGEVREQNEKDK
jgi:hypothetical protein